MIETVPEPDVDQVEALEQARPDLDAAQAAQAATEPAAAAPDGDQAAGEPAGEAAASVSPDEAVEMVQFGARCFADIAATLLRVPREALDDTEVDTLTGPEAHAVRYFSPGLSRWLSGDQLARSNPRWAVGVLAFIGFRMIIGVTKLRRAQASRPHWSEGAAPEASSR